MITADELACLREGLTDLFPETVLVQRSVRASDGAGGHTVSWSTIATVKGRLVPESTQAQEPVVGDRASATQRWELRLPALTDVTARDRCVIGARTFDVVGVIGGQSNELIRVANVVEVS